MVTNAQLAARLLRSAADFFRTVGEQNEPIRDQMQANARTYDFVADLVEKDAHGESPLSREGAENDDAAPDEAGDPGAGEHGEPRED